MSELEQVKAKLNDIDIRLERHEGKIEKLLGDISESLQKITEVMIKQEVQEEASKIDREEINQLKDKYHELDKKADLAIQSEESIKDTAKEIKTTLKGALKWGFGLFGSLMILLVAAAIRAALT
jgi:D-ribose pyranose/furanose isomerase RbsD